MKENRYGRSRFSNFLHHHGVYVALVASLLAVGGVAVAGMGQQLFHGAGESSAPLDEMVEQNVTGQPDDRTTATTTTTTKATITTVTATTTVAEAPDLYVLPLTNTVQKAFSIDQPLYCETMGDWRIHTGVDFAGESGQTVKAVARGTVSAIEKDTLWGGVVTIDHGVGVVSRYYGVDAGVKVGDTVDVAGAIGKLSVIPCESAQPPHLHLEMTVDGQPVDPVAAPAKEVRYANTTE